MGPCREVRLFACVPFGLQGVCYGLERFFQWIYRGSCFQWIYRGSCWWDTVVYRQYPTNKNIQALKAMEEDRTKREQRERHETIRQDLTAELEDNLRLIDQWHTYTPQLVEMWNVHKSKLDTISDSELREQLRSVYAEMFKINAYAVTWQYRGYVETDLEKSKKKLRGSLESVLSRLKELSNEQ